LRKPEASHGARQVLGKAMLKPVSRNALKGPGHGG
jgi:hypothetical protein